MNNTKVYLTVFLIRTLHAGLHITAKAALNGGMSAYVFVFYRLVVSTLFLASFAFVFERKTAPPLPFKLCFKIFILSLLGVTSTFIIYSVALDYTSATLSSAIANSIPVYMEALDHINSPIISILDALLPFSTNKAQLGLGTYKETVQIKRLSGIMKVSGILLCLAGNMEMAFYEGPHFKPLKQHLLLGDGSGETNHPHTHSTRSYVLGTFLMNISNITWSLWMLLQEPLLKEYPSKLIFTTLQCLFSTFQSFFIALALERDFSRWKMGLDAGLISVIYCGIIVGGVTFYLQSWVIEKRGSVFLAMSTPITLIITILGSFFLLGELVNLGSVLGGLLMVGGLYSVIWGQRKEQQIDNNTSTEVDRKASLDVKEIGITQV